MLASLFGFLRPTPKETPLSVKNLVESAVNENRVVIFSKSYCPYCRRTKALFEKEFPEETPVVFELNEREDGDDIQNYLRKKTKQGTVPNIFVNQNHVGGNDDAQAKFRSGELKALVLGGPGATPPSASSC
ncbi:hypothetical protein MKEN_00533800 [Mycena kentingensis (nom. inval.)]|nr:hypothetical protein MKEN_00533800 [Mycena kentingensis (nom. inval.)]